MCSSAMRRNENGPTFEGRAVSHSLRLLRTGRYLFAFLVVFFAVFFAAGFFVALFFFAAMRGPSVRR